MPQDIHAHVLPVDLLHQIANEPTAFGVHAVQDDDGWTVAFDGLPAMRVAGALVDIDKRLEVMDDSGIDLQVLSPWIELVGSAVPAAAAPELSRAVNASIAALVSQYPGRFDAIGAVPLTSKDAGAAELRYAVQTLGLAGAEIPTQPGGRQLDDRALDPFWAEAQALRALVLIHPHGPRGSEHMARHRLTDIVGNPSETSAAVGHLVLGGVLDRFPDLRICLPHGGGTLPILAGRFDNIAALGTRRERSPSQWLRTMHFDSLTHGTLALRALISFAGADRVVLGSDYPFDVGDTDPVGSVQALGGSADEQRAICDDNLTRLRRAVVRPNATS